MVVCLVLLSPFYFFPKNKSARTNDSGEVVGQQSLSGKEFLGVVGFISVIGIVWALLVSFIPQLAYVAFFAVMFCIVIVGPILYFRIKGIWKGRFRIKKGEMERPESE